MTRRLRSAARSKRAGSRLERQLAFVLELDNLKHVLRQNPLSDGSRRENDAEHSWHLAVMALLLAEHAAEPVDQWHVVRMLLVHDVVEIDAGDTFIYDDHGHLDKDERERLAADRLFAILPDDQCRAIRGLWEEFEARETPEARFAAAIDRLAPLLLNHASGGGAWRTHAVTSDRVRARNAPIGDAAPALWAHARALIDDAIAKGFVAEPDA